jgi:hypothetical protein
MNSLTSRSRDRFATTRWSMVMRSAKAPSANVCGALGELAQRYWYPVYVYVCRGGHAPDAAERIARSFLQRLLSDAGAGGAQGPYRGYLLSRLHAHLADGPPPDAGDTLAAPDDLEARYRSDHLDRLSPEQGYQRAFALQVVHRTLHRLRSDASQTGLGDLYELLEPFLGREAAPGECEQLAERLRAQPMTVVVALKRLRQRFRELAAEELVDTVTSADDLAAEQDTLLAVLGGAAP